MLPPQSASIERPYGWIIIAASLALMTIATGSQYVVVVALKSIAAEFDWPRWVPSAAYSLSIIGTGLGGILLGAWSDRIGVAVPSAVGAVAVAGGAALASLSSGPVLFLAVHALLIGVFGTAASFTPLVANATRWFDRRRGIAVSVVICGQFVGGFVWPLVFRPLIEDVGWRQTYILYAVFALVSMLSLSLLLRPKPPTGAPAAGAPDTAVREDTNIGHSPAVLMTMLCCAGIGCCIAMSIPMVHVVAFASDLGYPLARAAECLSVLLGFGFVSRLTWGAISDRIGGLKTLIASSSCQMVMLSAFMVVDSLSAIYVVSALYGLAFGGIVPSYSLVVRQLFPLADVGRRIGTIYLATTVGMALGGLVGGVAFDLTGGYVAAFAFGVFFNLVNLALVAPLVVRHNRATAALAPS